MPLAGLRSPRNGRCGSSVEHHALRLDERAALLRQGSDDEPGVC